MRALALLLAGSTAACNSRVTLLPHEEPDPTVDGPSQLGGEPSVNAIYAASWLSFSEATRSGWSLSLDDLRRLPLRLRAQLAGEAVQREVERVDAQRVGDRLHRSVDVALLLGPRRRAQRPA